MDLFSRNELRALLAKAEGPCVSLFMPTTRGAGHEDKLRWKNLVRNAQEGLTAAGGRASDTDELLRPARQLLDDVAYWQNVSHGLAAFLAPALFRSYRLPMPFTEHVSVHGHFHIKPLLPLLTDGRFYILALEQKLVRLLQGTRQTIAEIPLPALAYGHEEGMQTGKQGPLEYFQRGEPAVQL